MSVLTLKDEILTSLKAYLAVDVSGGEWDEEPSLVLVTRVADGTSNFQPLPVPEAIWSAAPVPNVLWATAHTSQLFADRGYTWLDPDVSLLGVALFSEGWGVSTSVKSDELHQIQDYMKAGGRLADHPLGVECKMVTSVLVDGTVLMLTHFRNGETLDSNDSKDGVGSVEGRVPDGLKALLAALQGELI